MEIDSVDVSATPADKRNKKRSVVTELIVCAKEAFGIRIEYKPPAIKNRTRRIDMLAK